MPVLLLHVLLLDLVLLWLAALLLQLFAVLPFRLIVVLLWLLLLVLLRVLLRHCHPDHPQLRPPPLAHPPYHPLRLLDLAPLYLWLVPILVGLILSLSSYSSDLFSPCPLMALDPMDTGFIRGGG